MSTWSRISTWGLLLAAPILGAAPGAGADTLYDLYAPPGVPGPGPRGATSLWRVTLTGGWGARCADGTTPVIYVRKGSGSHANDWIFHIPGGGSGADPNELLHSWTHGEHQELSSRWADESKDDGGIWNGNAANPFHEWNMVSVDKCAMDRFLGTRHVTLETTQDVDTPAGPLPSATEYEMWFQGALIVEDAVQMLKAGGVSYLDRTGTQVTLPSLADAGTILWTGSSGGSRGALMLADGLRERVFPPNAEVRLVADAGFFPAAELVADLRAHGWASGSIYDGTYGFDPQTGTSTDVELDTGARAEIEAWGAYAVIDQSCLLTHLSEQWKCFDEEHVLMNHVATPFFVRQDLYDRNHLTPCWQVDWRDDPGDCYFPTATPLQDARHHAAAIQYQLGDLARFVADHDEGGLTAEPVGFGPRCGQHIGLTDGTGFVVQGIDDPLSGRKVTFAAALEAWLQGRGRTLVERSPLNGTLPAACQ
jgi:pectinacetylesterase